MVQYSSSQLRAAKGAYVSSVNNCISIYEKAAAKVAKAGNKLIKDTRDSFLTNECISNINNLSKHFNDKVSKIRSAASADYAAIDAAIQAAEERERAERLAALERAKKNQKMSSATNNKNKNDKI